LAAECNTTLNALAIEALNDLLKKRGKHPIVENPPYGGWAASQKTGSR
jgi:hypothetical protein